MRSWWIAIVCAASVRAETFVVLPFANLSKNAPNININWVGESISETLRETLSSGGVIALDRDERDEAFRQLGIRQKRIAHARQHHQKLPERWTRTRSSTASSSSFPPARDYIDRNPWIVARLGACARLEADASRSGVSELGALEDLAALQMRLGWRTLHFIMGPGAPKESDFFAMHTPVRVDAIEKLHSRPHGQLEGTEVEAAVASGSHRAYILAPALTGWASCTTSSTSIGRRRIGSRR